MSRSLDCVVLLLTATSFLFAGIGDWKNFTDMKNVRRAVPDGPSIWAATSGGMFRLDADRSAFEQLRNSEGLRDNDLSSILVDNEGLIWTGAVSGIIHVYDPEDGTWRYITDISRSDKPSKRINALFAAGDTILIASDFGVSIFNTKRFEFRDTFLKFGSFPSQVKVHTVFLTKELSTIWVGTPSGLAAASLSSPNLSAPESWTIFTTTQGLPSSGIKAIGVLRAIIQPGDPVVVVGTDRGLATQVDSSKWAPFLEGTIGAQQVVDIFSDIRTDRIIIATLREVYHYRNTGEVRQVGSSTPFDITSVFTDADDTTWISMANGGIATWNGSEWQQFFPNGPNSNLFTNIIVTSDGVLWAGSGLDVTGRGFYSFNGTTWTNFSRATHPELNFDGWYRVNVGCGSEIWVSSWGRGLARVDPEGTVELFDDTDGFVGIPNDPRFVVCGDVLCDRGRGIWTTVLDAANGKSVAVQGTDGTWKFLRLRVGAQTITVLTGKDVRRGFHADPFGQKWLVVQDTRLSGLVYFTDADTSNGEVDVTSQTFTTTDGLASSTVTAMAVDRDGDIWVGTDQGITIITDPRNPRSASAVAQFRPLREQVINTIAVDALNNKWIGTREGVFYLSQDGTQLLAQYNVAITDGKLVDNDVKSIAIDSRAGMVYFGTERGLSRLETVAVESAPSFQKLSVAPNPYLVPSTTSLSIDGLVQDASIKIVSVDGRLIREFKSPGGRVAFWDGRNSDGEYVSSGIYFIVAASVDGNDVATVKVAVVRK